MTTYLYNELPEEERKHFFNIIKERMEGVARNVYIPEYVKTLEAELKELGFAYVDIRHTGFQSQCDSAFFTGSITCGAVKTLLDVDCNLVPEDLRIDIEKGCTRYVSESTISVVANYRDVYYYSRELSRGAGRGEEQLDELVSKLKEWVVAKNKELHSKIKAFYDERVSDDAVLQYIETQKPEFAQSWVML